MDHRTYVGQPARAWRLDLYYNLPPYIDRVQVLSAYLPNNATRLLDRQP